MLFQVPSSHDNGQIMAMYSSGRHKESLRFFIKLEIFFLFFGMTYKRVWSYCLDKFYKLLSVSFISALQ